MLSAHKLDAADFLGKNVSSLPDRPSEAGMTAAELKAAFDRGGEEVIASHFNDLIDTLSGNEGAAGIGTGDGRTVEKRLDSCVESENVSKLGADADGVLLIDKNGEHCTVGHRIQQADNSAVPNRRMLAFLNVTVTDDERNDRTLIAPNAVMSVNEKSGSHIILSSDDVGAASKAVFLAHAENRQNPHGVTAQQIGAVNRQELLPLAFDLTLSDGVTASNRICRQWGPLVSLNVMFAFHSAYSGMGVKLASMPKEFAPPQWVLCYGIGRTSNGELFPMFVSIDTDGQILADIMFEVAYISVSVSWILDTLGLQS